MGGSIIFEMEGIHKRFGSTQALRDVHLTVCSQEVHAVMGENGAGKSTLMKIMSGVYAPDSGTIRIDGTTVTIGNPREARSRGINLIYQELSVAPNMTVAENIFMGDVPRRRFGIVNQAEMNRRTEAVLQDLGARFSATDQVGMLSIAEQQQVEIARALVQDSRILIMDEPTAALSEREAEHLFRVVRTLRKKGLAILYISHRMAEVAQLADHVTVIRDGAYVGELKREDIDEQRIVQMMVGRPTDDFYQHSRRSGHGPVRLRIEGVAGGKVNPTSFILRGGEVTGMAGLIGAGRTELARLIFGADERTGGRIWVDESPVDIRKPADSIRSGVAYVPEDRKLLGLFLQRSVLENTSINVLGKHTKAGVLVYRQIRRLTEDATQRLGIKASNPLAAVGGLSGGNQQKVLLARWLQISPRVLILDEPTRGVDIGAKSEIYKIIHHLADQGAAILCISSDLAEIVGVSDRVLVMSEGRLSGEVRGSEITQERIMTYAANPDCIASHKN